MQIVIWPNPHKKWMNIWKSTAIQVQNDAATSYVLRECSLTCWAKIKGEHWERCINQVCMFLTDVHVLNQNVLF